MTNVKIVSYSTPVEEFEKESESKLREKQMKKWNRDWKIELIDKTNPDWRDLYDNI